ncbi:DUF1173 family protein (plasmid) [Agrobacterium tumefaciens]|uniref:DUF1173 family protein n=1 Tax=Agrobacterium tumefaciens TaxID=358 RepID=UPI001574ABB2|nr:DUF1173 family protein [Agrobacterium tumefaciens]WCA73016.1 DUF1173 family protein [Agrobacterium tumefaciens]
MPSYKFPSRVLADDDTAFDNELSAAHESRFRPACLCLAPAPEMYIARLGDKYFIKRMPGTGLTHHHGCEHFDPPPSLSGLGDVMGRAIQQKDDGHTVLKLDFSLTKVGRSAPAQASESKSDTVKAETNKLTLLGLLHYLWHEADLNKWSPRFAGRRNWPMVQARLIEAASAKETKKAALVERLYVPEPYYRERAQEIDGRRMKQLQPYMPTSANKTEMLIYVGELKNIEPSRFGSKLVIKHAPSFPIFMDEKMEKSVRKRFALELDFAEAHEQLKLVMIATAGLNRAASAQLAEVSIMLVNENWIPVESFSELQLIDHLTADKRSFTKTLRFNVKERPIASALLTDTTPVCAMYIQPEDAGEAYGQVLGEMEKETGMATWLWDAEDGHWPQIPEKA